MEASYVGTKISMAVTSCFERDLALYKVPGRMALHFEAF